MLTPWPLRMTLILTVLTLIFITYVTIHIWKASGEIENPHIKLSLRGLTLIADVLVFLYPLLGVFDQWFSAEYDHYGSPSWIIYVFWAGLIFSATMFSWLLSIDIIWGFAGRFSQASKKLRLFWKRRFVLLITAIVTLFSIYTLVSDTTTIHTDQLYYQTETRESSPPENLDSNEPKLRIAHITDIQADQFTNIDKMGRYIDSLNAHNPDIVIFTGDLVTTGTTYFEEGAKALSEIKAPMGTYAVMGDHDYWASPKIYRQVLSGVDIPVLEDTTITLKKDDFQFSLTGITEIYSKKIKQDSLEQLLSFANTDTTSNLNILMSHQANKKVVRAAELNETEMVLGGHTHGGQIRLPLFFSEWSAGDLETPYVSGHYTYRNTFININNGLGFTLAPVRYNAPANVSFIDIW